MFIVYYPYCKKCDTECKTCTGEGNGNCVDCSDNYFKNPAVINGAVGYQCLNTCPPGKFASNGACTNCGSTCSTCNSLSTCLTCNTGYLLNGICRNDCPDGYFPNKASLICQQCAVGCTTCIGSSINQCKTCAPNYLLYGTTCVDNCPDGSFKSGLSCQGCLSSCATCNSGNNCTSCAGT